MSTEAGLNKGRLQLARITAAGGRIEKHTSVQLNPYKDN